ncbi:hypothetical protein SPF06_18850 [Sinomonas sp. JGH33]|uniref:Uncharacterized protein n=1 Tax=Sinomonas terricola TaxID=3110330 RepID=A0ABU5TAU1_9MICC|nr:hypothetical protein [Sinomonas sp. JGH33]MEA5456787.1 hypothetical protein [Sinomonas sp. JGH33]
MKASHRFDVDAEGMESLIDAARCLHEIDSLRPAEITTLFRLMQYDNLLVILREVLDVLGLRRSGLLSRWD